MEDVGETLEEVILDSSKLTKPSDVNECNSMGEKKRFSGLTSQT
jgi:hypothetical protein